MRYARTCLIVLMLGGTVVAPAQERHYSVTMFGAFTTSSKLFPHPNDVDEFTRGQFLPLDDIFSIGVEFRREIKAIRVQLGLSAEYISKSDLINVPDSLTTIPVKDGFKAVPIELTGYFVIPFSGDRIQLKLQQAVLKLPTQQRIVFNMKYFDNMKYEKISEVLKVSVGALKATYHHAVKKVEKFITAS